MDRRIQHVIQIRIPPIHWERSSPLHSKEKHTGENKRSKRKSALASPITSDSQRPEIEYETRAPDNPRRIPVNIQKACADRGKAYNKPKQERKRHMPFLRSYRLWFPDSIWERMRVTSDMEIRIPLEELRYHHRFWILEKDWSGKRLKSSSRSRTENSTTRQPSRWSACSRLSSTSIG